MTTISEQHSCSFCPALARWAVCDIQRVAREIAAGVPLVTDEPVVMSYGCGHHVSRAMTSVRKTHPHLLVIDLQR